MKYGDPIFDTETLVKRGLTYQDSRDRLIRHREGDSEDLKGFTSRWEKGPRTEKLTVKS